LTLQRAADSVKSVAMKPQAGLHFGLIGSGEVADGRFDFAVERRLNWHRRRSFPNVR